MKVRTLACVLAVLGLLVVFSSVPVMAQEDTYTVQNGDCLWELAGSHLENQLLWEKIYKENPFLQEPGRRFTKNGIVYVMVRPGEKLVGLGKLGITAQITPIDRLHLPQQTAVYEIPVTPTWVWWILGFCLILLTVCYLIYRMLTKDPVSSRPAMVPGGVSNTTTMTPMQAMQQVAARAEGFQAWDSRSTSVYQQFTVVRQNAGRIWGNMIVRYADGRSIPRRLNGERAYQAEVRFPDGRIETLYMLQGCGNDLKFGGISRYLPGPNFRFEADPATQLPEPPPQPEVPETAHTSEATRPEATAEPEVVAPEPPPAVENTVPQAPPEQTAPEVEAPSSPAPKPAEELEVGVMKFELRKANNGQGAMARFTGIDETDDLTCEIHPGSVTLRFRPKQ